MDEHVRQEADDGQQAGGGAEDGHGDLDLGQRRGADGEGAVGGEAEHDHEDGGDHGAGGILREQDEADEHRDGQDEAAQDGLRGALDLRGDEADDGAGDEADAVGADEADDVHEVAVGVEALREVRRGVGSALVHGVAGEVRDAGPDDAGVLDGLDGLLDAEQLGVLVDLALEVGDDEEGDDAQDGDDDAQEDEHGLHARGAGDGRDDAGVDEADDEAGDAVDGVADADLGGVLVLLAAQADDLEARAPPHEDGGDAHEHEQDQADLHGRQHGVHEHEHGGGDEADPCQRAHAELVGHDAGGQVADHSGDAVGRHHEAEVGVGGAERLHQRIVEDVLQIHRRVDDRRAHGDEHDERPLVQGGELLVGNLSLALGKQ